MTRLTEVGLAIVLAVAAIVLAPGLAVAAMVALLVLMICGVSLLVDARRGRKRAPSRRRGPVFGRSPDRR